MAVGIVEKGREGLFENEIEFTGKYARMVRFLKDELNLFETLREAYVVSTMIGYANGNQQTQQDKENEKTASIFPTELKKKRLDLRFIYRIIMLTKDEAEFTIDDYKNRAFKDDVDVHKEIIKENMEIFHSYTCGGIEYLYDKFQSCRTLDEVADSLYDMIHEFSVGVGFIDDDVELPDFKPEY